MGENETNEWRRIVREEYPPGVTCWVDLETPDPEAATRFYGGLFGWEVEDRAPADQPFHYFEATLDGLRVAGIGSQMEDAKGPPAWNTYVWVEDADATARAVLDAGGKVLAEPMEIPGAGRMAVRGRMADEDAGIGEAERGWRCGVRQLEEGLSPGAHLKESDPIIRRPPSDPS